MRSASMHLGWLVLIAAVWATGGCRKAELEKSADISASPTAAPSPAVPHAIARGTRRAPEGVFFLLERVAVTTDSGVIGFPAGTRVRRVESRGDKFRVTDGTTAFDVQAEKLTDDVDLGTLAARQDAASQQAVAEYIRDQNDMYRQAREADKTWLDEQDRRVAARRQAAEAARARRSNPLDRGPYNQSYSYPYGYYPYSYYRGYPVYLNRYHERYWIDAYGQMHSLP